MNQSTAKSSKPSSLILARQQRSHVLLVLSNAKAGADSEFLSWYLGPHRRELSESNNVLRAQQYEQHPIDITQGHHPRPSFKYLALYDLALDGAHQAQALIERVTALHNQQLAAQTPATWLYYPASEKVGRSPEASPPMLTLAFANALPEHEAEFREWYATRHIRHALNIPALVSGQCFERTDFQSPGAAEPRFQTVAIYEQEGTPEDIIASFQSLPPETFSFPTLDVSRFAESVYQPI